MADFGWVSYSNNWHGFYLGFTNISFEVKENPKTGEWQVIADVTIPGLETLGDFGGGVVHVAGPTLSVNLLDRNGPVRHGSGRGMSLSPYVLNLVGAGFCVEPGRPTSLQFSFDFLMSHDSLAPAGEQLKVQPPARSPLRGRGTPVRAQMNELDRGRAHYRSGVTRERSRTFSNAHRDEANTGRVRRRAASFGADVGKGQRAEAITSMPIGAQRIDGIFDAASFAMDRSMHVASQMMLDGFL